MRSMRNVLVTGGGGFLGSAIVRMLVERNVRVRSFSRKSYPNLAAMNVEQIQGDIGDATAVANACKGIDTVFHTAAKAGVWGPARQYHQANVKGTENVIAACLDAPGTHLIHTSSPSVVFHSGDMHGADESAPYPAKFSAEYPKTKARAEQMVKAACKNGLAAVILRPHLIWGPGDNHLIPRILARADQLRRIGDGRNKVDTIYIENAAAAHLMAADALAKDTSLSGRIYFISQDDPIPLWEMVNHILDAGGKPPVTRSITPTKAYILGMVLEGIYHLLRLRREPPMTRFVARELATSHWFNISAAKKDLGYHPKISTTEGLQRLRTWLASQP